MDEEEGRAVVVGVQAGTPETVIATAAGFARRFGAELVCVHVQLETPPTIEPLALSGLSSFGGGLETVSPQPVPPMPTDAEVERALGERLEPLLGDAAWRIVVEHGGAADALARTAEREGAAMIVVGTQEGRTGIRDLFGITVAAHLARHQHRPVVVVPTPR